MFQGTAAMHLEDIIACLAGLRPAPYGSLGPRSLGSQLRTAGVAVENVYVGSKPRERTTAKGVKRAALEVSTTALVGNPNPGDNVMTRTGRR